MRIPECHLTTLRAAGLLVSEPFVAGHSAFPDGVVVAKPRDLAGNGMADYECIWGEDMVTVLDAPSLFFHFDGSDWVVTSHDFIPGPGPGDFVDTWGRPEDAVADIIDFFLGDPSRMDVKRRAMFDLGRDGTT